MENIKRSLFGYNRTMVDSAMKEKDTMISTQQHDIEYLQDENKKLKQKMENMQKTNSSAKQKE